MKEPEILHQLPTPFQVNVWSLPQIVQKVGLHAVVKCTYRKRMRVLGLLQKNSWCAKGAQNQLLFQQYDFSFNVYVSVANTDSKDYPLPMDQDRWKPWIQFFDNIEVLSLRSFWYHTKWHQDESLGYVMFILLC